MIYYIHPDQNGTYIKDRQRYKLVSLSGKIRPYGATVIDAADDAAAIEAFGLVPYVAPTPTAREVMAAAERNGIDVAVGEQNYRLRCKESDRAAFAQLATLILTAQSTMSAAQKTAHRASEIMITDAAGAAHSISVGDFQELVVTYGLAYNALWAAAQAS